MSLYNWNTELYKNVVKYFPKCWLRGKRGKRKLKHLSDAELSVCIGNSDIYPAGIQLVLNMGVLSINISGYDYGIYSHPVEDGKHVREYKNGPTGGQMGYYYPYKFRTIIFR